MLSELKRIVGAQNASAGAEHLLAYARDSSQIVGKARAVVWPGNATQVQALIGYARKRDVVLTPRGAGTGMCAGAVPFDGIAVDLSRMNALRISGRTCECGPGVVLDALNSALAQHSLSFPVQPSSHSVCSIGGAISTNASGFRTMKYGKMDAWVEEITAVDGNGDVVTAHGNDMKKFCGTEGTVGIITSAKLRLLEGAPAFARRIYEFSDYGKMLEKAAELQKNKSLAALEFLDARCSELLGIGHGTTLLAEFEDGEEDASAANAWRLREGMGAVLSAAGYPLSEDPFVPQERIAELLQWLRERRIPAFGHIASGVLHPRFAADDSEAIRRMYKLVEKLGGCVYGEHGIGAKKVGYVDGAFAERICGLKAKHDPAGILNRGKIVC